MDKARTRCRSSDLPQTCVAAELIVRPLAGLKGAYGDSSFADKIGLSFTPLVMGIKAAPKLGDATEYELLATEPGTVCGEDRMLLDGALM